MSIARSAIAVLLSLAGLWAPRATAETPERVTITLAMNEYRFAPARLVFRKGVHYRLLLENHGTELHQFTAPGFLGDIVIANPEILRPASKDIVLAAHERKELLFTAPNAGRFPLTCADHDWAGMIGEIVVE